jgi:hypothetical protein
VASSLVNYVDENMLELLRQHRDSLWVKILHTIWLAFMKLKIALMLTYHQLLLIGMIVLSWFLGGGWKALLLLSAAGVTAWQLWRIYEPEWRLAKLRRARGGDQCDFLRLCYREMERFFALRDTPRAPQITAAEYEQLLIRRFKPLAGEVKTITRLFQQAVYGTEPLGATQVEEAFQAVEKILHSKVPMPGRKFRQYWPGKRQRA